MLQFTRSPVAVCVNPIVSVFSGGGKRAIAEGAIKMMAWAQVKVAAVALGGVLMVAGGMAVVASQPVLDSTSIAGLSQSERSTWLLATLQDREEKLRNFEYSIREQVSVIDGTGREAVKSHTVVQLKRLDNRSLLHSSYAEDERPQSHPVEMVSAWDGKVRRGMGLPVTPHPQGQIMDTEHDLLLHFGYNHMLGFRVIGDFKFDRTTRKMVTYHSTLTEWMNRMINEKVPLAVEIG